MRELAASAEASQKGHRGAHRELVPVERVDEIVELFPELCSGCAATLPQIHDGFRKRVPEVVVPGARADPHVADPGRRRVG